MVKDKNIPCTEKSERIFLAPKMSNTIMEKMYQHLFYNSSNETFTFNVVKKHVAETPHQALERTLKEIVNK